MSYSGDLNYPDFYSITEIPSSTKINTLVNAINQSLNYAIQHQHTGVGNDGLQIPIAGIENSAITAIKLATDAVETVKIKNDAVDKDKIAVDIAGDALGQNANGSLEVKTDGSTIETSGDALRVKALGIDTAHLATDAVETVKIKNDAVTGAKTTELLYDVHRQDNVTNSAVADQTVRKGWGFKNSNESVSINETVTFGTTFDDIPIVVATAAGRKQGSDPANLGELTSTDDKAKVQITSITTTNFVINISVDTDQILSGNYRYGYTWIAIGTKTK